jgi:UPF0755 protein
MKLIPPYPIIRQKRKSRKNKLRHVGKVLGFAMLFIAVIFSFPRILALHIDQERQQAVSAIPSQFPVTVNPQDKTIAENAQVDALFENTRPSLQAAVGNTGSAFWKVFAWIAETISEAPEYQAIAGVAGIDNRIITITPGMRKEQAASVFGDALGWDKKQEQAFITTGEYASLPLPEGSFEPGIYLIDAGTTPAEAQEMVNQRFSEDILSHYGTTTAQIVPLDEALTVASLIQREASGQTDMRIISGIIWNRLFAGMNLQIDATVQYAEANKETAGSWWPAVLPKDIFIKSPYNTYLNPGLPPTPIANPSVAAVLAALNPVNTPCFYYFHDKMGQFHCSDTYAEHVALLKKYYGQGK